ncbi:hypothetical protein PPL_06804 [Heterostelium album PN500]|uniref:Uncharacterized protein n=1 Tax=Heterostelium pallidum (strain ATCC 26659 / Pp 5 / PN500) TaxID=670386 RepID=D3BDK2_HETP5|nr:hypothetical protein PPL_06804 [Heterostelium album PN500]EFA79983.1 hypothetical protein PPL_06804 [Heterostelium album PN500]|eukprot:XP_020432103.1 hypothetical protein PPL_06804 [Heterostelium album PN500]
MADVLAKDTTVKEIENSLKKGGNYKIVFVITLDSGRIKAQDLSTLNYILESIKTDFNYGLIINQVSIEDLDEKENQLLNTSSIEEIQIFLSTIPSINIDRDQVKPINMRDYDRKLMELEQMIFELMKTIKENREREERLMTLNENSQRLLEQEIKANRDLDSQGQYIA